MHSMASFTSCTLRIFAPFCSAMVLVMLVPFNACSGVFSSNLYIIDLGITVKDRVHVADVMRKIRVMPDVQRVYRKK